MDMKEKFRLLDTGRLSGAMNMALDEAILEHVAQNKSLPTIRFYAWERPTLSLGYFQRLDRDVDMDGVKKKGFDLVRRMTGGRAVLHDQELTYSVIIPGEHEWAKASVVESYHYLSFALRDGFRNLGVEAEIVSLADEDHRETLPVAGSAACFDSPSWYELVVGGKKIAGSAQVRAHGGLLQHGSLLLDLDVDDLFSVLKFRSTEQMSKTKEDFLMRAVSVKQLTGKDITWDEATKAFADGFESGLGIELVSQPLLEEERTLAKVLAKEKYSTEEWTKRR